MRKPSAGSAEQCLKCIVYSKTIRTTDSAVSDTTDCQWAFPLCRESKGGARTRLDRPWQTEHKGMSMYVAVGAGSSCLE